MFSEQVLFLLFLKFDIIKNSEVILVKLLKVMILGCLLLSGCSRIQVPNNEDTNNKTPEVS